MQPELTFFRVRSEKIGYGRMGVYLAEEMKKQGVTVYDEIQDQPGRYVLDTEEAYADFGGVPTAGLTNIVLWASVPSHARGWWKGQVPVMFTMFETDHLPTSFRENLHEFDTLIVPSEQNLEMFSRYHDNVKYVPLGVDLDLWHYQPRKMPTTRFNFLIGGRGQRKGTDLAYKAFRKCFPNGSWGDGPVPHLILKTPKPEDYYGDRIEAVTGYIPAETEVSLYANAHCYLGPSRGEGFGLQPLQAMAQGCPTILTDAHGHKAFSSLGMGISSKLVKAGYFIYGDSGVWWEPDFDELCDTMLWTYHNYAEAAERAATNAQVIAQRFTWANSARGVLDAIGMDRLAPYSGPKEWYEPTGKLYKVFLIKDHTADIGGNIVVFEKGEEYRVTADVKRVLFDAGLVDIEKSGTPLMANATEGGCPVWDAGDEGLLPEQVEHNMPKLWLRQSYCPTCRQKYGSGTTLSSEIMAGTLDIDSLI
jgi:glycosyltransferase involved in cell wall biosynthesis